MAKTPINTELHHMVPGYDPTKAHEYYMRTRKLKGRKKGQAQPPPTLGVGRKRASSAKEAQKLHLKNAISGLEEKLGKLEDLIKKKEALLKTDQARKKVAARKKDAPKTAADKAKAKRESKQYRQKHHTKLAAKAKQAKGKSGGGHKSGGAKAPKDMSIADLKALATKVKGQIALAKQKLAAL